MKTIVRGYFDPGALGTREIETLQHLANGLTMKEIAATMGVKVWTVETHIKHAIHKTATRNALGAVVVALKKGLVSFPDDPDTANPDEFRGEEIDLSDLPDPTPFED